MLGSSSCLIDIAQGCLAAETTARVAVIGGGIGGAFTAAFLRDELNHSVAIDV